MKISDTGLKLIEKFEGLRLKAYQDSVGVWTIGYGHTKGVKSGDSITQAKAEEYLRSDVSTAESKVNKYLDNYGFNQNQFDALVSFAFNIGNIDGLTKKGTRTISEISSKFTAYNKAGGKVLSGLTTRRKAEKSLFDTPTTNEEAKAAGQEETSTTTTSTASTKETSEAAGQKVSDTKMPTIRQGSTGRAVKIWQIIIGQTADGSFGAKTLAATKSFQKSKGLTADGIVGANTWKAGLLSVE